MTYQPVSNVTPTGHLKEISAAYRLAGVAEPRRTNEVLDAIKDGVEVDIVAATLAFEAFSTTLTVEEFMEDALQRMSTAQAMDTLRKATALRLDGVTAQRLPTIIDQAARDLEKPFNKVVADLTKAAAKLDKDKPLDMQQAFRDDTSAEVKVAMGCLAALGQYNVHGTKTGQMPPGVGGVIGIVNVPDCVQELGVPSMGGNGWQTINQAELGQTLVVRRFCQDVRKDPDKTLIGVAQGIYEGLSFGLADTAEVRRRIKAVENSDSRKTAKQEEVNAHRVVIKL